MKDPIWIVMMWPAVVWIPAIVTLGSREDDREARDAWQYDKQRVAGQVAVEALARYHRRYIIGLTLLFLAITAAGAALLASAEEREGAVAWAAAGLVLTGALDPLPAIVRATRTLHWLRRATNITWTERRVFVTAGDRLVAWMPITPRGLARACELAVPRAIAKIRREAKGEELL